MEKASRIKVVHLITLLEFGGAQGNTIYTVQNLDPKRFETHLWSGKGAYWDKQMESLGLGERLRFFPSLVRNLNPILDVIAVCQLASAFKTARPDVLHTHSSKAGILGRIAAKIAGIPVVIHTFHGFGFNDEQKPWTRWLFVFLEKLTAPLANKLVFVSESNLATARKENIGTPDQYTLIRSGVPIPQIKANGSAKRGSKVISTIGAFKPQKNLFDFLQMAHAVHAKKPDVQFLIMGDGALRPALEARIAELKLGGVVKMPGWREDAAKLLAGSEVFVMTSLWEGLPRALVEAMILGLPPVCYDTDGVRDLLKDEEGTLVTQRDIGGLTSRVLAFLDDAALWDRVSKAVSSRIGVEFDIDHMVRQQETLYQSLLER